ncbi:MAG: TIGR03769 domain-containing protein [Bifidobacteriaceae bacterium]|nr:TIGR03769 domain-containing protein [Bifidobacteriaceae bacterium]
MNTILSNKRASGLAARAAAVVAGAAALTLGVGVGGAFALPLDTIDAGSYDAIEVGFDSGTDQLVVGGHDHGAVPPADPEFNPEDFQFETDQDDLINGGWTIAEAGGPLSLGIAAEGDLWDDLGGSLTNPELTITISNFSGPGDLVVWEGSSTITSPIFDTGAVTPDLSETIELHAPAGPGDESYHQHYSWNFSATGTYTFEVVVSEDGIVADPSDAVLYTFVVS